MQPPGPLRLQPVLLDKVWAADALNQPWAKVFGSPKGVGEVWLASARHQVTKVAEGELAGVGLDEITERWPKWITGQDEPGGFPLLVKLLSVGQWLSVQVHPNDEDARRMENEPWGKSEAWHVLQAVPGSQIIHGLAKGVDAQQVAERVDKGDLPEVLAKVRAQAGDTFGLPAGTVHATGPGLLIFEVQQASDVTYRFYDWDRPGADGKPRELHQAKALKAMSITGPGEPVKRQATGEPGRELLLDDPHFSLYQWQVTGAKDLAREPRAARVVFVLSGQGEIQDGQTMDMGSCWLIPAGLESCQVRADAPGLVLLEACAAPHEGGQ